MAKLCLDEILVNKCRNWCKAVVLKTGREICTPVPVLEGRLRRGKLTGASTITDIQCDRFLSCFQVKMSGRVKLNRTEVWKQPVSHQQVERAGILFVGKGQWPRLSGQLWESSKVSNSNMFGNKTEHSLCYWTILTSKIFSKSSSDSHQLHSSMCGCTTFSRASSSLVTRSNIMSSQLQAFLETILLRNVFPCCPVSQNMQMMHVIISFPHLRLGLHIR